MASGSKMVNRSWAEAGNQAEAGKRAGRNTIKFTNNYQNVSYKAIQVVK